MDPFSITVGTCGLLQAVTTGLKLVKKHLALSNLSGSEAGEPRTSLYRFHGPLATFQTHLQRYDDDDDDSGLALEHLRPVIQRSAEALQIVNQYLAGGRTGKLLRGVKFDQRLKTALKCLDDASKLFTTAIMTDQQYVVINSPSPCHVRFKTHPRPARSNHGSQGLCPVRQRGCQVHRVIPV